MRVESSHCKEAALGSRRGPPSHSLSSGLVVSLLPSSAPTTLQEAGAE